MAAFAAVVDALEPVRSIGWSRQRRLLLALQSLLGVRSVETRLVASTDPLAFAAAAPDATLVWVETPTNPGLDASTSARRPRHAGARVLLVVDNTLGTAAGQDPFTLRRDLVVGFGDERSDQRPQASAVIGLAAARDPMVLDKLRTARTLGGAIPGVLDRLACAA